MDRCEASVILTAAAFSPPLSEFVESAVSYSRHTVGGGLTFEQVDGCLNDLFEKGLIQIVDEVEQNRIRNEIRLQSCHGPVLGFPRAGCVDLTKKGAEAYKQECRKNFDDGSCSIILRRCTEYIFGDFDVATQALQFCRNLGWSPVSGPVEVGHWKVVPWCTHTRGYLIEVEQLFSSLTFPNEFPVTLGECKDVTIEDFMIRDVIQGLASSRNSESRSLIAELSCLASLSGLFGAGPLVREGLYRTVRRLSSECQTESDVDVVIDRLLERQLIAVAERGNASGLAMTSDSVLDLTQRPVPGQSLILTIAGIEYLKTRLGDRPYAHVFGVRGRSETRMFYANLKERAEREVIKCRKIDGVSVGEIERIGKWCRRWWDLEESGCRFKFSQTL